MEGYIWHSRSERPVDTPAQWSVGEGPEGRGGHQPHQNDPSRIHLNIDNSCTQHHNAHETPAWIGEKPPPTRVPWHDLNPPWRDTEPNVQ